MGGILNIISSKENVYEKKYMREREREREREFIVRKISHLINTT